MKSLKLNFSLKAMLLALLCTLSSIHLNAENTLTIKVGSTEDLTKIPVYLIMTNDEDIQAFQASFALPDGLGADNFNEDDDAADTYCVLGDRAGKNHIKNTVEMFTASNPNDLLLSVSPGTKDDVFSAGSDVVATFTFDGSSLADGTYAVYMYKAFLLTNGGNTRYNSTAMEATFEIKSNSSTGEDEKEILVTSLGIGTYVQSINVGESFTLTPKVLPENATNKEVAWTSSNEKIATVTNGVVTGMGAGTALITAKTTDGSNLSATCTVNVYAPVTYVNTLSVKVGSTGDLTKIPVSLIMSNEEEIQSFQASFALPAGLGADNFNEDDNAADTYCVLGERAGKNHKKNTVEMFTATNPNDLLLSVTPGTKDDVFSAGSDVVATFTFDGSSLADGTYYVRLYSDFLLKTADERINCNESYAYFTIKNGVIITDETIKVTAISLDKTDDMVELNKTTTLVPAVSPSTASIQSLTWTSSDNSVATVKNGVVTGVSLGSAIITATTKDGSNLSASCNIKVIEPDMNTISIDPVTAYADSTKQMIITLKNKSTDITSLQFDIKLPSGVSITKDEEDEPMIDTSDRSSDHNIIEITDLEDGYTRILCGSSKNTAFSGSEGTILVLNLTLDANAEVGNYLVYVKNIVLSTPSAVAYKQDAFTSEMTIKKYTMGDVNQDGGINVADMTAVISLIMHYDGFPLYPADFNKNNIIEVGDFAAIINLIMSQPSNVIMRREIMKKFETYNSSLAMEGFEINKSSEYTFAIKLNSEVENLTGIQFDMTLPEGISLVNIENGPKAANHKIAYSKSEEGVIRCINYSMQNEVFSDEEEKAILVTVKADEEAADGDIQLSNIVASTTNSEAIGMNDVKSCVTVGDATNIDYVNVNSKVNGNIYDMNGRQKSGISKGFNIINGKKVYVQ